MNNIEIYKDSNLTIEIDEFFHEMLNEIRSDIKLTESQYEKLLNIVLFSLKESGFNYQNCKLITSSKALIIKKCQSVCLVEDFKVLEFAFNFLSTIDEEDEDDKEQIITSLQDYYKNKEIPFYISFFEKSIFEVDGAIVAKDGDKLLITYFIFSN